ncbi:site-specific DNA-methyltransferase [Blastomonas sp.]|uniref:site-specific DNA-methyltransferase n=1 Tax=Blastomonas sp. TaxID=1909299 RepID=UPI0026267B99|nr:site-specific DNA-methyltransferase [Blastomonas sp.]MDM7955354.1 site-specific DNA-methyltransferase [Blastomonas sp.]
MARAPKPPKSIDALKHDAASRRNIPTAEMESFFLREEDRAPRPPKAYPRERPLAEGEARERAEELDPQLIWNGAKIRITKAQMEQLAATGELELGDAQLVWRGKDTQDWSDLIVNVPPLYIQEKIHPKAIIDDLKRRAAMKREAESDAPDMFADFNGIEPGQRAEFYQHDQHWSNRMILGDSLQVMASLAERESLRGKVQCIYFDPPYGIKFNSNWQVSTRSTKVEDGKQADISREPEQVKAFRDTWKDSIHSYLAYLRDRLTVARDLLTDSGSIFVQIGDENVHRVRALLDEVFGDQNFSSLISYKTSVGLGSSGLDNTANFIVWYFKDKSIGKVRSLLRTTVPGEEGASRYKTLRMLDLREMKVAEDNSKIPSGARYFRDQGMTSRTASKTTIFEFEYNGKTYRPNSGGWRTSERGMDRVKKSDRFLQTGKTLSYRKYYDDFSAIALDNVWSDVSGGVTSRSDPKVYVVQTGTRVIERCILMATDPGDLVLDPTCGSGSTAYVAEQWGRRWITMDTSRVALALARTRLMTARYPWYLLADSKEGRAKEAALTQRPPADTPFHHDIRQGFVYERVPHITLKSIANNPLIDDIWDKWQQVLESRRAELNQLAGKNWQEWEIPRDAEAAWSSNMVGVHASWWEARVARQKEIDSSIAARADVEYLYDKPYQDTSRVRVAGPFTVESLSPHRVLPASEEELIEEIDAAEGRRVKDDDALASNDFAAIVIDYLKAEGVKQQDKGDRITFESLLPWPGNWIGAQGTFMEGPEGSQVERRAAILIGPEFGTVGRADLVAAAREAADARFDLVIACAFNFDAHSSELGSLGSLRILKARINPDMHMSGELKNTGRGNMFIVFGEPDVDILDDGGETIRVKVNGVDVFDPNTGDIRSNDTKGIAAWFIDTDYNEESFFVRHAYFLGANDPYKSLKTALKAEIDEDAWATLYSDTSRPFERPANRKIAVKVINHFGDEVMKVFGV